MAKEVDKEDPGFTVKEVAATFRMSLQAGPGQFITAEASFTADVQKGTNPNKVYNALFALAQKRVTKKLEEEMSTDG